MGWFVGKIANIDIGALRFMTALFGLLLCLSPLLVCRDLGRTGTSVCMMALALSPALVFFSRYAIHEMIYACFSTYAALFLYLFFTRGSKFILIASALAWAYASATKETVLLMLVACCLGVVATLFSTSINSNNQRIQLIRTRFTLTLVGIALAFFMAGLLTWFDVKEMVQFFKSYAFYFELGTGKTGHEKPWYYFYKMSFRYETFLFLGGILGMGIGVYRRRAFDLFCLGWAMGLWLVHSLVSYKTPWIIVNLLIPLAFLLASLFRDLWASFSKPAIRLVLVMVLLLGFTFTLSKSYAFSFKEFYEPKNRYSYVHTFSETHEFEQKVKAVFRDHPQSGALMITDESWPFPYIMRAYPQFHIAGAVPKNLSYPIIFIRMKFFRSGFYGSITGKIFSSL